MRIVGKKEFYNLPSGTIFSKYQPIVFTGLFVKGNTLYSGDDPIDYIELSLIGNVEANDSGQLSDILFSAQEEKKSFKLDFDAYERDGLYEEEALYAVYEKEDINQLINTLQESSILINN